MSRVRDKLLYSGDRLRIGVWNVWWWFHTERVVACITRYVGPFVFCWSNT